MHQASNLIYQWAQNNLDVVFFFYGLAFFVMGLSILMLPKKESAFKLANILWLLAGFGIVHGTNEWMDMWVLIKHGNEILDFPRLLILIISFIFLFEFGRRLLIGGIHSESSKWQKMIAQYFGWWVTIVIAGLVFLISFITYHDFWKTGSIFARYFLCFPGALLTGFGFFSYYQLEETTLKNLKVKSYFLLAGLSFIFYGCFSGLIVPRGEFFPANWVNDNSFFSIMHIPVQVFRAILAIIAALSIIGIIKIFNWERRKKLEAALVTDELTGLYNSRGFFTVAEQQLKMSRRLKKGILVIVADLDGLKTINDTFGHKEGDIALINTSKILKESFRESDVIGRIGGDEFAVFQIENNESSSQMLIARLVKNCNIYNKRKDLRYKLSISAGIVRCDPDCKDSLDEMLGTADKLMYDQKKSKIKS